MSAKFVRKTGPLLAHEKITQGQLRPQKTGLNAVATRMRGSVLFITLIFILIMSMLTISGLELGLLNNKINQREVSAIHEFIVGEKALRIIEQRLMNNQYKNCLLNDIPGLLPDKPQKKCTLRLKEREVEYYIEYLDYQPCAQFDNLLQTKPGADIYRITVTLPRQLHKATFQSTIALASAKTHACQEEIVTLSYGRLSWRQTYHPLA